MVTTRHRIPRVLGAACAITVVALAGCTGDDSTPATPASAAADTTDKGDGAASKSSSTPEDEKASPLEEFLGFRVAHRPEGLGTNVPELNPNSAGPTEKDRRDQLRMEQLIAECMRADGFDYHVGDPFAGSVADPKDSPYALPRDEFAARYGYGISTIDLPNAADVDPNYAALATMTPAQRQAYLWALDGGAEQGDTENTGCRGDAVETVFGRSTAGGAGVGVGDEFAHLVEEIRALGDRVDNDPRVAGDANRRWSDCMADAGHPGLTRPSEAPGSVTTRLAQARATRTGDNSAVAEVRRFELALAHADLACRPKYDAARRTVRDELERRFLDEHRSELERYRQAMSPDGTGR